MYQIPEQIERKNTNLVQCKWYSFSSPHSVPIQLPKGKHFKDSFPIPLVSTWTKTQLAQVQAQPHYRSPGLLLGVGAEGRTTNGKKRPGSHWTRHLKERTEGKGEG